ncbi:hypothetical protein [Catellatospora methionotrophica]|uniref:Cap15 family cyclic dinucleotide receptor domain-containing protein n=1 Tax=Catellatospora methionotrophica TaxID=121620 RepID=UPI0033F24EFE
MRQSASSLTVTLFTDESSSNSKGARLTKLPDDRWSLSWLYENVPRLSVRDSSDRHCGAAEVFIGENRGEEMSGEYFTDRLTQGELHFTEWSPRFFGNAKSAIASSDFEPPQPFIDTKRRSPQPESRRAISP